MLQADTRNGGSFALQGAIREDLWLTVSAVTASAQVGLRIRSPASMDAGYQVPLSQDQLASGVNITTEACAAAMKVRFAGGRRGTVVVLTHADRPIMNFIRVDGSDVVEFRGLPLDAFGLELYRGRWHEYLQGVWANDEVLVPDPSSGF